MIVGQRRMSRIPTSSPRTEEDYRASASTPLIARQ